MNPWLVDYDGVEINKTRFDLKKFKKKSNFKLNDYKVLNPFHRYHFQVDQIICQNSCVKKSMINFSIFIVKTLIKVQYYIRKV